MHLTCGASLSLQRFVASGVQSRSVNLVERRRDSAVSNHVAGLHPFETHRFAMLLWMRRSCYSSA
jgi:hypothetical protein